MCNSCSMLVNIFLETILRNPRCCLQKAGLAATLHVCHTFLYISLLSLQDYNVKLPYFMFCGRWKHKTTTFFFFSSNLLTFDKLNKTYEISVLSLKQHNSVFKLHFCSCQVRLVRSIFSSCSKYGTFESEYLRASDKANIWEWHVSTPYEFLILRNQARA